MTIAPKDRLFVALDTPDVEQARSLARSLATTIGGFKVGLELFGSAGPELVRELVAGGSDVFVDLKFHDIPNTVAGAAAAITRLGASHFTVHATGGPTMIRRAVQAAREVAAEMKRPVPTVLAVTVLTSHDDDELETIGLAGPCGEAVSRLATMAREAGAGGLVCSAMEVASARKLFPDGELVVPGIRPGGKADMSGDDQSRVATPAAAVALGADRLVIGRPITRAGDPAAAARAIADEIERG
jgi:orotidine-5'-phosphate decarboxylase